MDPNTQALLMGAAGAAEDKLYIEDVFSTYLYTGNGSTQTITNGIALVDGVAIQLGTALGGGYFAGFISHTADGVATHALIVAPRATGASGSGYTLTTNYLWKTANTGTTGTTSSFDGAANTAAMVTAGIADHPAAQFCVNLSIGGYSDWYLPARYELDIAYYNLKPTTASNSTSWGINDYSVPKRTANNTAGTPAQTSVTAFKDTGSEPFVAVTHWSSTEFSSTLAWLLLFDGGIQGTSNPKTNPLRVRAFRRIPISDPLLDPYRVTGEGGLVWVKHRNGAASHALHDTERGASKRLFSNSTNAESTVTSFTSFDSSGFTLGSDTGGNVNFSGYTYASWTFRKAAKFFDVVTYTGDGTARTIAHNLGSVPGCIIVKRTDTAADWQVYHREQGPSIYYVLNSTAAALFDTSRWNGITPTSSVFSLGTDATVNASGGTYVAYLFAHDAGGFGDSGNESVVKCGIYTGNGSSSGPQVNLDWEPQWVMIKRGSGTGSVGSWYIYDNMRGVATGGVDANLKPNDNAAESSVNHLEFNATGFKLTTTSSEINAAFQAFTYIAIRRGPMKTPTSGTEVFKANTYTQSSATYQTSDFPVDTLITSYRTDSSNPKYWGDRLRGGTRLESTATSAEAGTTNFLWDSNTKYQQSLNVSPSISVIDYAFRRAPGFFDVVAYTGNSLARTINHNLGVAPELWILKCRTDGATSWQVGTSVIGVATRNRLFLQSSGANDPTGSDLYTVPTNQTWGIAEDYKSNANYNQTGQTYILYLFATLTGISKVFTFTGNGGSQTINCGFTTGARFVLIKRTDSTGNWLVADTARGIVSGDDPLLYLNSTAAEITNLDWLDPDSSGFIVNETATANANVSGATYIGLAIA